MEEGAAGSSAASPASALSSHCTSDACCPQRGPQNTNGGIIWELLREAESQASSQNCCINPHVNKNPRYVCALKFESYSSGLLLTATAGTISTAPSA